jgi:hypothetical protein
MKLNVSKLASKQDQLTFKRLKRGSQIHSDLGFNKVNRIKANENKKVLVDQNDFDVELSSSESGSSNSDEEMHGNFQN